MVLSMENIDLRSVAFKLVIIWCSSGLTRVLVVKEPSDLTGSFKRSQHNYVL